MAEEQDVPENKIGKYELLNVIAGGTSCQIWEVSDGNQTWAMKALLEEKLEEPEERNSLRHEGKVLQKMSHPAFVAYRDMEIGKKASFLVMEYFRGPNLKTSLKFDRPSLHARFEQLLEQVCLGLGYMHEQGFIHRDIKPDNILFSKEGELKLVDFSLSVKFKTGIAASFSGGVKHIQGTRTYIAPETIQKKQPSPQTDMYSLGISLYEVLTGKTPFAGASPNDLLLKHLMDTPHAPSVHEPNITPELDIFILKLLKKNPKSRFASMSEALTEIRSLKLFKEDPASMAQREKEEKEKVENTAFEDVLDSRRDAARSAAGIPLPPRVKKIVLPKPEPEKPKTPEPVTPQPVAQQMPQQLPPGYHPPPPGYPQQQPMPPGMMPFPTQPGGMPQWSQQPISPGPQPGAPLPGEGQQAAPAVPQAGAGQAPSEQQGANTPEQKPASPKTTATSIIPGRSQEVGAHPSQRGQEDDELPEMDDLPDVI